MATTAHLEQLNAPQRKAVTHGEPLAEKGVRAGPAAGGRRRRHRQDRHDGLSGAHLVLHGVDSARLLMLTFTRRAATEMRRGVHENARGARRYRRRGDPGRARAASWAGTFHSVADRLLRHYARHLRLDPTLQRVDRARCGGSLDEPAQRTRAGAAAAARPAQGHLPRDLLQSRRYALRLSSALQQRFPWCARLGGGSAPAVPRLRRAASGTPRPSRLR